MKAIILTMALCLSGCALTEKPNNAAAFTSDQIVNLAVQVERAQANGLLSEVEGDEYLAMLLKANALLQDGSQAVNEIELCGEGQSRVQCIDQILQTVEAAL